MSLIKNQYPGQSVPAPGSIGAIAVEGAGTVRAKSGILAGVTHLGAGSYQIALTEPFSTNPVNNPISCNVNDGLLNPPFIIHAYTVGNSQINVYTYSLIQGVWTHTDLRWTLSVSPAPTPV